MAIFMLRHHKKMFEALAAQTGEPDEIALNVVLSYHRGTLAFYDIENNTSNRLQYIADFTSGIRMVRERKKIIAVPDNLGFRDFKCCNCVQKDNPTGPLCVHFRR